MSATWLLATRPWRAKPLRVVLCLFAVILAVGLVTGLGMAMDSLRGSIEHGIAQVVGRSDISIRPSGGATHNRLQMDLVNRLRADPDIILVAPRLELPVGTLQGEDSVWVTAIGVELPYDRQMRPMRLHAGHELTGVPGEIIVDFDYAERYKLNPGDKVAIRTGPGERRQATIAGITIKPELQLMQRNYIHMRADEMVMDTDLGAGYTVIDIAFKPGVSAEAYAERMVKESQGLLQPQVGTGQRTKLQQALGEFNKVIWLVAALCALCSAVIIGSTLLVGIQERIRQYGMLLCIGAPRPTLGRILLIEAGMLTGVGLALGIPLGALVTWLILRQFPELFSIYAISQTTIIMAMANGILAVLLGSMIPMFQLNRVQPMAAVRTAATPTRRSLPQWAAVVGLGCIALQIALWQIPGREWKFWSYLTAGIPLIFVGYTLLGPLLMHVLERPVSYLLARYLGMPAALLRHAWTATPWRLMGMMAALMLGVTFYTTIHQRSAGLMAAWQFPSRFPDMLMFNATPLSPTRVEQFRAKQTEIQTLVPVGLLGANLDKVLFRMGGGKDEEHTNFVFIEPESFRTIMELEFIRGNPDEAWAKMNAGGHILVAREFYIARQIDVGHVITLQDTKGQPVDFTVAGVISSPGFDIAKSYFDLRWAARDAAIGSVLGSSKDAYEKLGARGYNFMLCNLKKGVDGAAIKRDFTRQGLQVTSVVEMKKHIEGMVARIVSILSLVAIIGMAAASLGVSNMVVASLHARRYELGVLRAIGAGRGQLLRLIIAEIALVALTASVLGCITGMHYVFMGTRLDRIFLGFPTEFMISPGPMLLASGITMVLAWLASLWPAWRAVSTAQRAILAAGRG